MTGRPPDRGPAPPDAWSDLAEAATRVGHEAASVQRYRPPAAGPSSVPTLPMSTVLFTADPERPAAGSPGPPAPEARAGAGETFQVPEQIGRGGMGVVYRAVQASLGREVAVIIGIGFAAMAFQARRWLLAPASLFFAGGILMAALPERNLEIMAALWLLGIGGVGVAIRLGATIDPREAAPRGAGSPGPGAF